MVALLLGLLLSGAGAFGLACLLFGLACLLMPLAFVAGLLTAVRPPRRVALPGLVTFRDLAYALAGQQPRGRIQPTP